MKNQNHSSEIFNEIVFENRNKAYGAYVLRKSYGDTISKSLLLTIAFFSLIVFVGVIFSNKELPKINLDGNLPKIDSFVSILVELPRPKTKTEPLPKVKEPAKPKADNTNYSATNKKTETNAKINEAAITKTNGEEKGKDSVPTTDKPYIPLVEVGPPVDNNKIEIIPDVLPEFDGDLFQFLSSQLKYPVLAAEARTQGTVYLTFVVEKSGEIGDIKILKGVSEGCTEEALRVVKSMPKWKPGRNKGQPVRVQYNLPVKFRLQ